MKLRCLFGHDWLVGRAVVLNVRKSLSKKAKI